MVNLLGFYCMYLHFYIYLECHSLAFPLALLYLCVYLVYSEEKTKEKAERATLDLYYTQSSSGSIDLVKQTNFTTKFIFADIQN